MNCKYETDWCKNHVHCSTCSHFEELDLNLGMTLAYSKTPEQEIEEQLMVDTAESYLESLGIKVKTNYGYYRNIGDILKDFGAYLSKNNKYTLPAEDLIGAVKIKE